MQQQLDSILRILSGSGSQAMSEVGLGGFLFLMCASLASSLFVAWLYRYFYATRATGSDAYRAFPLLGISITAIFIAIQFSLPLSLGLLGALSIVRFRTPIKEPEEIGFIMLVIATALACATFKLAFLGIILIVAVAALIVQRIGSGLLRGSPEAGLVVVSIPDRDGGATSNEVARLLRDRLLGGRLESLSTNADSTVFSYAFRSLSQDALLALQAELREKSAGSTVNIFFNRPAVS
jgi:hypothetical protein